MCLSVVRASLKAGGEYVLEYHTSKGKELHSGSCDVVLPKRPRPVVLAYDSRVRRCVSENISQVWEISRVEIPPEMNISHSN